MAGRRPGPHPGQGQMYGQSSGSGLSREMPARNSADDEDDFNPQFSSLRLHGTGYPGAQMMFGDGGIPLQSPYGFPSISSPHPGNGQNHQQYTPLQSPYLPSGIPPGPPVGMPPRPGFPYARSDMPEPIHHGHSRIPYEYPPPLVQQHPQHAPHMPLHQRSHTSPAHVAPPGFAYEYAYGSPPMSPNAQTRAMGHQQQMRGGPSGGRRRHARHGSFADEQPSDMYQPAYPGPRHGGPQGQGQAYQRPTGGSFGMANTPAMSNAPSNWTSPGMQSSAFNTPHQPSSSVVERAPSDWSEATSPVIPHAPAMPTNWRNRQNRMSWSGQAKDGDDGEKERKAYHPQAPAKRSDWVMWVGNVPQNTSHEELWRYFNATVPEPLPSEPEPSTWKGPSSIFLISRSSCAFVNLSSQSDLDRAVAFFNGRPLRAWDNTCPRMVCRVRLRDDDLKSGVGAQRGTGMHREWVKAQAQLREQAQGEASSKATVPPPLELQTANPAIPLESPDAASSIGAVSSIPPSPAVLEHPPEGEGRRRESIVNVAADIKHKSTNSYASTNSSFLVRHFPRRFFILKSATTGELQEAVQTGTWRTQRHNEPVLDQAFRTAAEVILIFGANKAGEFFGYARMVEHIDKDKAARRAAQALQSASSGGSTSGGSGGSSDSILQGAGAGASGVQVANAIAEAQHAAAAAQRAHAVMGANPDAQRSMPALSGKAGKRQPGDDPDANWDRARAGTDPTRPKYLSTHSSSSQVNVSTSPGPMTPAHELSMDRPPLSHHSSSDAHTDSLSSDQFSIVSAPPAFPGLAQRPLSSDFSDKADSLPLPGPINTDIARLRAEQAAKSAPVDHGGHTIADIQAQIGGSKRQPERGDDGVLRKDTAVMGAERAKAEAGLVNTGREKVDALEGRLAAAAQLDGPIDPRGQGEEGQEHHDAHRDADSKGLAFRIEWVKVGSLPFARTRMLRNPWNNDREVKVSRDGTEVEPGVGAQLLSAWDPSDTHDNLLPQHYIRPAPTPLVSGSLHGSHR